MSSNTLTGVSPASTYEQLLHIGTGTLGTGAVVRLGDGTPTAVTLTTTGMQIGGGDIIPTVWKRLTAVVTATDTTPVPLAELDFTPENGATYALEMLLIITSAATAGAAQIANSGGTGTLYLLDPQTALGIVATAGSYAPTTSPVAGTWALMLKGIFTASSTAALTFSIQSDDTNDVTALAGSYLRITKIS